MKTTRILIFVLLIAAVIIPGTASASGFKDDKVVFGSNFTLKSGETLNGDLVVFGGNLDLESSSTVNGDAVVFGGNVNCNGTINGNLVAMGGLVELGSQARVDGDLTALGSSFEKSEGAVITGNVVTEETVPFEFNWPSDLALFKGEIPSFPFQLPFVSASLFFFKLLIWSGLAVLLALFIQDQADVINKTAFAQPFMSFLVGMGVVLFAPLVLLALILTIILSPISLLGIFALIAAWVVGLVALSLEIGKKLGEALNQTWPYPVTAGLGMFILMLFLNGFNQLVPCFGLLPKFVLGMWVLGAVVLTRFGTSEYPETDPIESHPADQPPLTAAFEPESPTTVSPAEVNATQAAVDLAEAEGIDLGHIKGTGANGRITLNDVRKALKE